jgi:hypothetical protein
MQMLKPKIFVFVIITASSMCQHMIVHASKQRENIPV